MSATIADQLMACIAGAVVAGGGGSPRYWRFVATAVWNDWYTPLAEVEWVGAGDVLLAGGGVEPGAQTSSVPPNTSYAYDQDQYNAWYGEKGYTTGDNLSEQPWVGYDFGASGSDVASVRLQASDWGANYEITAGMIQSSQDGTNWDTVGVVPLHTGWVEYSWYEFPIGISEPFLSGAYAAAMDDVAGPTHTATSHEISFGTPPSADRLVAVAVTYWHYTTEGTPITDGRATSVTIGGVSATRVADSGDMTDKYGVEVWVARPSTRTGTVSIVLPWYSQYAFATMNVFCVPDAPTDTPNVSNSSNRTDVDVFDIPLPLATAIPANTGVVAVSYRPGSKAKMTGIEHAGGAAGASAGNTILGTEDVVGAKTITLDQVSPTANDAAPRVIVGWAHST